MTELIGVGIDQVDVAAFEHLLAEDQQAFFARCFTSDEIAYCSSQAAPAQHFAARFAAKEAAVKAFNSVAELAYWQVEVRRSDSGAPALSVWDHDRTGPHGDLAAYSTLVSLTHTDSTATAIVVVARPGAVSS